MKGLVIQFYRGASGYHASDLPKRFDCLKALGVTGVAPHGFCGELSPEKFAPIAQLAHERELSCMAAFGLGPAHAGDRGAWMGSVAALECCDGLVMDAEGAFDLHQQDAAREMCAAVRAAAPKQFVADQPWFAPRSHKGFPWAEFSACVDMHNPQVYQGDFVANFGDQRYRKVFDWYDRDWSWLESQPMLTGLVKPRGLTIEGYRWRVQDAVDCLLRHSDTLVLVWCEPWPDDDFVLALRAVQRLRSLGFDGDDAVRAFQLSPDGKSAGLAADGVCGPKTLAALEVIG